jgi:hypothetical protein
MKSCEHCGSSPVPYGGHGYRVCCVEERRRRNRERAKKYTKQFNDKEAARQRKYRAANREKARAWGRNTSHRLRLKRHGLTQAEYDDLLSSQGACCAVCKLDTPGRKRTWSIDHCHKTGRVRGLLCNHCNSALGHARDNPSILRALASYLEGNL